MVNCGFSGIRLGELRWSWTVRRRLIVCNVLETILRVKKIYLRHWIIIRRIERMFQYTFSSKEVLRIKERSVDNFVRLVWLVEDKRVLKVYIEPRFTDHFYVDLKGLIETMTVTYYSFIKTWHRWILSGKRIVVAGTDYGQCDCTSLCFAPESCKQELEITYNSSVPLIRINLHLRIPNRSLRK